MKKILIISFLVSAWFVNSFAAEAARIKKIEGKVTILRKGSEKWRDAGVNTILAIGDQVYTREESFAEIKYVNGAILRMDEKSKIVIKVSSEKKAKTETSVGNVWINMKKLFSSKSEFELNSPSATAAIRGTIFHMETNADSTTEVSVYNGTVAVGPSSANSKKSSNKKIPPASRYEVQGPTEIPGPYEVTLEDWKMIVVNQKISVRKDGKFNQEKFDPKKTEENEFVRKNRELDALLGE